jgi:hypothetical protein
LIGALLAVATALVLFLLRGRLSAGSWAWFVIFPGIAAGLGWQLGWLINMKFGPADILLCVFWWLIPALLVLWLMAKYDRQRKGVFVSSLLVLVLTAILFVWLLFPGRPLGNTGGSIVIDAVMQAVEWLLIPLQLSWLGFFIGILALTFVSVIVIRTAKTKVERLRSRRTAWTVNLTILLPALAVMVLNLALWQGIATAAQNIPAIKGILANTVHHPPEIWMSIIFQGSSIPVQAAQAVDRIIHFTGLFLGPDILLLILGGILMTWALSPAVFTEIFPPRSATAGSSQLPTPTWLGSNLSHAFGAMRIAGELIRWGVILLVPVTILLAGSKTVLQSTVFQNLPDVFTKYVDPLGQISLVVLGYVIVAMIASRGYFRSLVLGFRTVIDVALGVINWLRLHPLDDNPRARICARYVSLLRHICHWKAASDGRGYNSIVIFAHSQGTVITADLLRFLETTATKGSDNGLGKMFGGRKGISVYLFTMGCPLRQLYNLRFPHLYDWVKDESVSGNQRVPDPKHLALELWVNTYRSGDYVGRYLWQSESPPSDPWEAGGSTRYKDGDRQEFCLGAGAHTHYWDADAEAVAFELDELIHQACQHGSLT